MARDIKNKALYKALAKEGIEDVILVKAEGYFFVTSDNEQMYEKLRELESTSIYVYSFAQQSIEEWVEDIKRLFN